MGRKQKLKNAKCVTLLKNVGSVNEECGACLFKPYVLEFEKPHEKQMETLEWEIWDQGFCPACGARFSNVKVENGVQISSLLALRDLKKDAKAAREDDQGDEWDASGTSYGSFDSAGKWVSKTYSYKPLCDHKEPVLVGDGVTIYGYSHRYNVKIEDDNLDLFVALYSGWTNYMDLAVTPGIHLTEEVPPLVPMMWLNTPDQGIPVSLVGLMATARHAVAEARAGKKVACGCMGGHGRTGFFLATCAMMAGGAEGAKDAIKLIQSTYCKEAIESELQEEALDLLWRHVFSPEVIAGEPMDSRLLRVEVGLKEHKDKKEAEWQAKVKTYTPATTYRAGNVWDNVTRTWKPHTGYVPPKPAQVWDQATGTWKAVGETSPPYAAAAGSYSNPMSGAIARPFADKPTGVPPKNVRLKEFLANAKALPASVKRMAGEVVDVVGWGDRGGEIKVSIGGVVHALYAYEYEPVDVEVIIPAATAGASTGTTEETEAQQALEELEGRYEI